MVPNMPTCRLTRERTRSASRLRASARLVSGPSVTRVTGDAAWASSSSRTGGWAVRRTLTPVPSPETGEGSDWCVSDSGLSVSLWRGDEIAYQRPSGAGVNRDVRAVGEVENCTGISRRGVDRRVSIGGRDRDDLQL